MTPEVDVVILTWNDGELLDAAVASALASEGVDVRVIVVDNGSDPPAEVVADRRVELIANAENRGVAAARNQGVLAGDRAYVCLLDSDAVLHPGALRTMVDVLVAEPDVAVAGPVFTDQAPEASGGLAPTLTRKLRRSFGRTDLYESAPETGGAPWWPVDFVIGACQVLRRAAYRQVGGIDESFFYGPEDVDFCLRLRSAGWDVVQVADAPVDHPPRRRFRRAINRKGLDHGWAVARFLWRHRSTPSVAARAPAVPAAAPASRSGTPLVTVAIPTYQRAERLARAIDSVLGQDYPRLELVISDNASTDGTADLIEGYVRRDDRVRSIRQPENVGPIRNFEALRSQGKGELFLFLGDDDWFDPGYVSACVAWLQQAPATALVAGRTVYHRGDGSTELEPAPITIAGGAPSDRLLAYWRQVRANGVFYGVMTDEVNRRAPALRNVQGLDMLHVAACAYLGDVRTLDDVAVHRSVDGMSTNLASVGNAMGLGWWETNAPQVAIAMWVFRDVAFDSPLYAELGRAGRLWLGARAGAIIFFRFVPPALVKFARLQLARRRS